MSNSHEITRRALLGGAAISSAAFALAVVPAARGSEACALPVEHITDKLDRLTQELSAVMGEYQNGQFTAIVGPGDDVSLVPIKALSQRAKFHAAALANALNEIRPGDWQVTIDPDKGFALLCRHEPNKTFGVYERTDFADRKQA